MIDPPIFPAVERVTVGSGKEVIVVEVTQGQRRPYSFKGKGYRRVGTSTLEMSRDEYNRLLLEQLHATARWENEIAVDWRVNDLDITEIVRTLHDLSVVQQHILRLLGSESRLALREIFRELSEKVPLRRLRKELLFLKELGLVEYAGHAKGARWFLQGTPETRGN